MNEPKLKVVKDESHVEEHHHIHIPNRHEVAGAAAMFGRYMYNKKEGTVMGRNRKTWGRILSFYLVYYGFLSALGVISIEILKGSISFYTPNLQTRLQFPALKFVPMTDYDNSREYLISNNKTTEEQQSTYNDLVKQIKEFLEPYRQPSYSSTTKSVQVCGDNGIQHPEYSDSNNQEAESCFFDLSQIDPVCTDETKDFGYAVGTPCVFFSLNRIIGWEPAPFLDLKSKNTNYSENAVALHDWLAQTQEGNYDKMMTYVVCNVQAITNDTIKEKAANVLMTPAGLHSKHYPFLGFRRQPSYRAPFVAVKFTPKSSSAVKNEEWVCRVYARNILTEITDLNVGGVKFMLSIVP